MWLQNPKVMISGRVCSSTIRPFSFSKTIVGLQRTSSFNKKNINCRVTMEAVNSELKEATTKAVSNLMLVSDLDFTMVDHDDHSHQSLLNFNSLWAAEYGQNSILVYSSGRTLQRYKELRREAPLLTPAILVSSIGTEIFYGKSLEPDLTWRSIQDQRWNREIVMEEIKKFPQLEPQAESDQRPHKISFYLDKEEASKVMEQLMCRLQDRQVDVKMIFSGGNAFDVLPKMGGKGEALAYLMQKMKKEECLSKNILVCGDSGNDTELYTVGGVRGVIVSNAHEELVQWYKSCDIADNIYHASERCAGGIIQALRHFAFGPYYSPREKIKDNKFHFTEAELKSKMLPEDGSAKREVIEFNLFLEMWLTGHIHNKDKNYQRVMDVIANGSTMVYPWGKESNLKEALNLVQQKYGLMKGKKFMTWIDNIDEKKLAKDVYLVTWESWEKLDGAELKGYYATAILVSKEKTPNGVEWVRVHETSMNPSV